MKPRKPLKRRKGLSPASTNPDRRRRLRAQHDRQYGRDDRGDFAAFVRAQGCCVPSAPLGCYGPIEAAHVRSRGADPGQDGVGGMANLCREHHAIQHALGIGEFQRRYGLHLRTIARALAQAWERDSGAGSSPPRPAEAGTTPPEDP